MDKVLAPVRDLTDSAQNQAVLDEASALGGSHPGRVAGSHGPAVAAEAADLLTLVRTLDLDDYVTLIEHLRAEDRDDPALFGRRWPVQHLRDILHR